MPIARRAGVTGVPRSVSKALKLLRLFAETRAPMGLTEIATRAGIPKGTVHRLLIAMEEEGFVLQDGASRNWGLGFRALQQYNAFREQMSLLKVASPWMQRLRDEVQETVSLVIEDSGYGVCIERFDPNHELRFQNSLGVRVPLHAGATRKALLAFLPEDRRESILSEKGLPAITPRTITNPDRLREELARIRERGYAESEGEHNQGVAAVGVPLRDVTGQAVASLSIAGPAQRLTPEQIDRVLPVLLHTAQQLSSQLGFRG